MSSIPISVRSYKLPKFAIDIFPSKEYTYVLLQCVYYYQGYCAQVVA